MKIEIERPYIEAMVTEFPGLATLKEQLRFGNRVEVAYNQLAAAELEFLGKLYQQAGPEMQVRAACQPAARAKRRRQALQGGRPGKRAACPCAIPHHECSTRPAYPARPLPPLISASRRNSPDITSSKAGVLPNIMFAIAR